jgi:hypothetical protein
VAARGPKTEAGRDAVRVNAVRHGILSTSPVVPGLESYEEWEFHREQVLENHKPAGYLEEALAERVAQALWRLQRVVQAERGLAVAQQAKVDDHARLLLDPSRRLQEVHAAEAVAEHEQQVARVRAVIGLLAELQRLPDAPALDSDIVALLLDQCSVVARTGGQPGVDFDALVVEGFPEGTSWHDYDDWTAGTLRKVIAAVAIGAGRDVDDFQHAVRAQCEAALSATEAALRREQERASSTQWEHVVPRESQLQQITRYEAHLNRQFY